MKYNFIEIGTSDFEANILTELNIIDNTLKRLTGLGYNVIMKTEHEIIIEK